MLSCLQWDVIDSSDGKIVIPYTFQADFPWKTQVNQAIANMNEDLGCVKIVLVPEADVSTTSAPFINGIVIAFENLTGNGCYSALGRAPGFVGRAPNVGITQVTEFGVPRNSL